MAIDEQFNGRLPRSLPRKRYCVWIVGEGPTALTFPTRKMAVAKVARWWKMQRERMNPTRPRWDAPAFVGRMVAVFPPRIRRIEIPRPEDPLQELEATRGFPGRLVCVSRQSATFSVVNGKIRW